MKPFSKVLGIIALVVVVGFSMITCANPVGGGGDGGGYSGGGGTGAKYIMDVRDISNYWDIMVAGTDGSSMFLDINETTGKPSRLYIKPKKNSDIGSTWLFNEDGLPDIMISNDHVFTYSNFRDHKFDMMVEKPNGDIEYFNNNQTDIDWDAFMNLDFKENSVQGRSVYERSVQGRSVELPSVWDVLDAELDFFGKALGTISCLTALTNPASMVGCAIFVLQEVTGFVVDKAFTGTTNDVASTLIDALGCLTLDPIDCTQAVLGAAGIAYNYDSSCVRQVEATGVTTDTTAITLNAGEYYRGLTCTISPSNTTNKLVSWESGDDSIVTCLFDTSSLNPTIIAKKEGTTTITVTKWVSRKKTYKSTCTVTVLPPVAVTGVSIDNTTISLAVNDYTYLNASVSPSNASNQEVKWESSNPDVVSVSFESVNFGIMFGLNGSASHRCQLHAKAEGTATITVTTLDGNIHYAAICAVTVDPKAQPTYTTGLAFQRLNASGNVINDNDNIQITVAYQVSKGTVTGGEVAIPASFGGLPVTKIAPEAFKNTAITGITIPNSVTTIGYNAFRDCTSLTGITIPSSVTSIQGQPNNSFGYSYGAFEGCTNLASVTFAPGSKITTIGYNAFYGCASLTSVTIPHSVTSILSGAFYGCTGLTSVTIGNGVINLNGFDFPSYTNLTSVTIGNSVENVKGFNECKNLTSVIFASGSKATTIESVAFRSCTSLASITIPSSVTTIDDSGNNSPSGAFYGCTSLASVIFEPGSKLTKIGNNTFRNSAITAITIPNSVTTIGYNAFRDCTSLTGITIPSSVTSIQGQPNNNYGYSYGAFEGCTNLASVTFAPGSKITTIGYNAFYGCTSLTSVTIPHSVTSIQAGAFYGCTGLVSITIGNGVTNLNGFDFNTYPNLASVTIGNSVENIKGFNECKNLTSVIFASGSKATTIGSIAFRSCTSLASITIPSSITSIDNANAFYGCTSLTSVIFEPGSKLTKIGSEAFRNCTSLTGITIPDSVTSIGDWAFRGSGLTSITIPDSVTSIASYAFEGCTNLVSVEFEGTIPSSGFSTSTPFPGDLRAKFYATDSANGTAGTYTRADGTVTAWTKQ